MIEADGLARGVRLPQLDVLATKSHRSGASAGGSHSVLAHAEQVIEGHNGQVGGCLLCEVRGLSFHLVDVHEYGHR